MTQHQEIMSKLNKIDDKLDNHLERITKVEVKVEEFPYHIVTTEWE